MLRPSYAIRVALGSGRARTVFVANLLGAGGVLCGGVQLVGQLFPTLLRPPLLVLALMSVVCLIWAVARSYPRTTVRHEFTNPTFTVVVQVGDLFEQDAHLVVGFSDTFDTLTRDDVVISERSVQGQLLDRWYEGDHERLDRELDAALAGVPAAGASRRSDKEQGKLVRYPVGTTATLRRAGRRVFAVAYGRMGDDLVTTATLDDLWHSLGQLWDAIHRYGSREAVAMPLVGSGLARLDVLDRESLLKVILLSFVARSRRQVICRELRVVVRPSDLDRIRMYEIASFLRGL